MKTKALTIAVLAAAITGCMANSLPEWQSASEINVNVNTRGVVYVASASDADGDPVKYRVEGSLPGGWALDADTGELTASPRQTADAPAGATIQLVAYDNHGGNSPLTLTVNFEYGAVSQRALSFPPSGSSINLKSSEVAILLLANQPNANGAAITGATLTSEDQQTHAFNLHMDGEYWQVPMLLGSGEHQFSGSVEFDDGSSETLADYLLTVNQSTLQGQAENGQVTTGHQVSDDGQSVYFMSEANIVRQSLIDGATEIIWSFNRNFANYYFGVHTGEQKISVLEQKNPLFKLSSPAIGVASSNDVISGEITVHEIDLVSGVMTEKGVIDDPVLDYGPYVIDYDAKHHRFLLNLFIAGVGGMASTSPGPNGESQVIEETSASYGGNGIFEIDPDGLTFRHLEELHVVGNNSFFEEPAQTSPVTQVQSSSSSGSFETAPLMPIVSIDGENNFAFSFDYEAQMLTTRSLSEGGMIVGEYTGFERDHLLLAADSLGESRIGAVSTGLAYNIFTEIGGLYSTAYILEEGMPVFKTACDTSEMDVFNWQSPIVQPYPAGCINGVAYDLTVVEERNFAVVTAINALNLPIVLTPNEFNQFTLDFVGDGIDAPTIMQSVQIVSLVTGQVVTLYTGY